IPQHPALRRLVSQACILQTGTREIAEIAMKKVLLVGGGKIGIAITEFLSQTGDYRVTVLDRDAAMLSRMPIHKAGELREREIASAAEFAQEVEGHDSVLS